MPMSSADLLELRSQIQVCVPMDRLTKKGKFSRSRQGKLTGTFIGIPTGFSDDMVGEALVGAEVRGA